MEVDHMQDETLVKHEANQPMTIRELDFNVELLSVYYDKAFPYDLMFKWLSYFKLKGDTRTLQSLKDDVESDYFHNREFCFTLENDVYCRYLCFKDTDDFKKALVDKTPHKIDIGAVYNIPPKNHLSAEKKVFVPMEKEMIFDIDMTDYDNVRTCCEGARVCQKCWSYMACAVHILNNVLTKDFGFNCLLWVFSGRRGIHCWIGDEQARNMTNEMRTAVTDYIHLGVGNEFSGSLELQNPLHPMLEKAFTFLNKRFEQIIVRDQDLLSVPNHQMKFIKILPFAHQEEMKKQFAKCSSGMERWVQYTTLLTKLEVDNKKDLTRKKLVFTYLYPRLDANVSKGMNHLLKSPFCIHPKTGKVCIPFDPKTVDQFDVNNVPTLNNVIKDIGESNNGQIKSLEACFTVFKKFLEQIKSQNAKANGGGKDKTDF